MREHSNADSILAIFEYAKRDPKYAEMNGAYGVLEDLFDKLVAELPDEDQDVFGALFALRRQ